MKNYIKKYLEQVLKGIVTGISIFIGISICVLSINAFDWSGVPTVSSGTALTSSLWNTSMSTITGSIQTLQNTMVALTGDQTINGTKTFTGKIVGPTPTATNDLTTKAYVDGVVSAGGGRTCTTLTTLLLTYTNARAVLEAMGGPTNVFVSAALVAGDRVGFYPNYCSTANSSQTNITCRLDFNGTRTNWSISGDNALWCQ